eukprot:scaffold17093_cov90-Skeletonema_dohrnii-CCMP3373.AAC.1
MHQPKRVDTPFKPYPAGGPIGTSGLECDLGNSIATLHPQVMRYDVGVVCTSYAQVLVQRSYSTDDVDSLLMTHSDLSLKEDCT